MRINSIDYLRGILSLLIVFYHLRSWLLHDADSSTMIGVFGVYGVSIFYLISGSALFLAHKADSFSIRNLAIFYAKRFLRVAPVYWFSMLLVVIFAWTYYDIYRYDFWTTAVNITLLFGFLDGGNYIVSGGWSIGNEMVYYLLFPLIIISLRNKLSLFIFIAITITLFYYFSFHLLNAGFSLASQWLTYINPLNNIIFFVTGILVTKLFYNKIGNVKKYSIGLILVSMSGFYFYPTIGDQIKIVTGLDRVFYTIMSILLFTGFFMIKQIKNKFIHGVLKLIGDLSYSIYLIHAVVFWYLIKALNINKSIAANHFLFFSGAFIIIVIVLAFLIHKYIEIPTFWLSRKLIADRDLSKMHN